MSKSIIITLDEYNSLKARIKELEVETAKWITERALLNEEIEDLRYRLDRYEDDNEPNDDYDDRLEMGFDPYLGCYTDDC